MGKQAGLDGAALSGWQQGKSVLIQAHARKGRKGAAFRSFAGGDAVCVHESTGMTTALLKLIATTSFATSLEEQPPAMFGKACCGMIAHSKQHSLRHRHRDWLGPPAPQAAGPAREHHDSVSVRVSP